MVKYDGWGNPIGETTEQPKDEFKVEEAPKEEPKAEAAPEEPKKARRGRPPKAKTAENGEKTEKKPREKKAKTASDSISKMKKALLKKCGGTLPDLKGMFLSGSNVTTLKVKDIAICLTKDPIEDEIIESIHKECQNVNVVNYEAELSSKRVKAVMEDVLSAGKFFFDIEIAEINKDDIAKYQCVSGRNRLAGIALLWGADVEVPVVVKKGLTLKEARLMTVYANDTRKISRLEKASIHLSEKLGGDIEKIGTDDGFTQAVDTKTLASDYTLSLLNGGEIKLSFPVQMKSDHTIQGFSTTISAVEAFFKGATSYTKGDTSKEFKAQVDNAAKWLNKMYKTLNDTNGFVVREHFSKKALSFYGGLYKSILLAGNSPDDFEKLANRFVQINGMGSLSKSEIEKAYTAIVRKEVEK